MKPYKILIIEDEPKVASIIQRGVEEAGYISDIAFDGIQGKQQALNNEYDIFLIDVKIPGLSGYELCKEIRTKNVKTPIIFITAFDSLENKLQGFDSGADDYISKPFELKELLARIKVQLKRNQHDAKSSTYSIDDLVLNTYTKVVKRAGKKIELTSKEYFLLEYLVINKGRVISRTELAEKIWDIKFDTGTNMIDVYINYLRNKIDKPFGKKLIQTVIGMGYLINEED